MSLPESTRTALDDAQLDWSADAPLHKRVYWRIGGSADALVNVRTLEELQAVQRIAHDTGTPLMVLGKGSNLLIADAGIRGIVVQLTGELADTQPHGEHPVLLTAGAGLPLVVLLSRAKRFGWTGLACFAGIPGTIGGAVRMNAGSTMGETVTPLRSVDIVHRDGSLQTLTVDALDMSYRTSHLPAGSVLARATFQTTTDDPEEEATRIKDFLARRKATQPLNLPSCGSTFRNPPGDAAGRLIEAAGLKGFRIGGAQVSEKHANFVVNLGACSAANVRAVIEHVQDEVEQRFGVRLEREVHFVGDWGDAA